MQRVLNDNASSLVLIIRCFHKLFHHKLVLHAHNVLVDNEYLLFQEAFMNLYLSDVEIVKIQADDVLDPK